MDKKLLVLSLAVFGFGVQARDVAERIQNRGFPSVFQAWNEAENLKSVETATQTLARHDLVFHSPGFFGLEWNNRFLGQANGFTASSVRVGLKRREELLALNPQMVLLAEIRYRDAAATYLPETSPFWKRDAKGQKISGWAEGNYFLLDFSNPLFQKRVAAQCKAAVASGVFDGCFLDWWSQEEADRVALIKQMRLTVGDTALIMVNVNDHRPIATARYINGVFMEGFASEFFNDWKTASGNLAWATAHLRTPAFTAFEGWADTTSHSRSDLQRMRRVTTLALTQSNGYVLFGDPNSLPSPDHLHDWYSFWDKGLGKPTGPPVAARKDGAFVRDYQHGTAVFNPPENLSVTVQFNDLRKSRATGLEAKKFVIPAGDGDILLKF